MRSKKGEVNSVFLEASFQSSIYLLKHSSLLDSGTSLHVFNELSRFYQFQKAPHGDILIAGRSEVPILGYGCVDIWLKTDQGIQRKLRLKDVAFCTDFNTNLVSISRLLDQGYHWNSRTGHLTCLDGTCIGVTKRIHGQFALEHRPTDQQSRSACTDKEDQGVFSITRPKRRRRCTTKDPRPVATGNGLLWHRRMGHPGPLALLTLRRNSLGVRLKGPSTVQCEACALGKIHRQITRRTPHQEFDQPGEMIHIDWTDLAEAYNRYVRAMFITDNFSGMVTPYFMKTHGGAENL